MRKYLQILLTPRLAEQVERHGRGHGEAVETARDDLAAYHTLLAIGARSLPGKFTLPEIEALLAITHGHMPREGIPAREELERLWADQRRAMQSGAWGVNEAALAVKLGCLRHEEAEALLDICRLWHAQGSHSDEATARFFGVMP